MISILAVGKRHESWVVEGIERYEKRLRPPFDTEWVLLPHSVQEGDMARVEESQRLLKRIRPSDYVVLLDERGKRVSSPDLSSRIEQLTSESRSVTIIIGGAFGVDEAMHARADFVLSLSDLVFPHQLVRLLLTEQLYRAQTIAVGGKYHHE